MSNTASNADQLAEEFAQGERDVDASGGGSGKQRTKAEQREHKKEKDHPEGDTRRIVSNAQNGEEKRRDDERTKQEKK